MCVPNLNQFIGNFLYSCIPRNGLEGAVLLLTQRCGESFLILVVIEARGLLADIALRSGMIFIAGDLDDLLAFIINFDIDTAIDGA